jgi:hypothetical protein
MRITTAIGTTYESNSGVDDLQALDGAEHGDRRGDHAVA